MANSGQTLGELPDVSDSVSGYYPMNFTLNDDELFKKIVCEYVQCTCMYMHVYVNTMYMYVCVLM